MCKTAFFPLLTHWRYCCLALSNPYINNITSAIVWFSVFLKHFVICNVISISPTGIMLILRSECHNISLHLVIPQKSLEEENVSKSWMAKILWKISILNFWPLFFCSCLEMSEIRHLASIPDIPHFWMIFYSAWWSGANKSQVSVSVSVIDLDLRHMKSERLLNETS